VAQLYKNNKIDVNIYNLNFMIYFHIFAGRAGFSTDLEKVDIWYILTAGFAW
jgi:hypothetical protein